MTIPVFPETKVALKGKKGLVVGIANDQSIAWGCAKAFRALGAELAVTYLNEKAKKHVEPLAKELKRRYSCRSTCMAEARWRRFRAHQQGMGPARFPGPFDCVLAEGRAAGSRGRCRPRRFLATMDVSCWSFMRMAHLAEPLMRNGGTLFTMTYYGSQMVVKNYNIMGVAKAALESAVRYIAAELAPRAFACTPSRRVRWRRAPRRASPSSTSCSTRRRRRRRRAASSASTTWAGDRVSGLDAPS